MYSEQNHIAEEQEKKNKRIALATSIGVHGLVLLAFLFVVAWRAPNPPLPEYGIELNFGSDDVGTGPVQPTEPAGSTQPSQDEEEQARNDQQQEEEKPQVEESKPQEAKPIEQPVVTKQESPVTLKEEKKVDPKPVEKPKEKEQKEVVKTETKPKETVTEDKSATKTTADKTTTDNKEGKPVSHGDDANKTGDKGDPKGLDEKGMFKGQLGGGSSGVGLSIAGWDWLDKPIPPKPTDQDQFGGKVVFAIEIDSEGYVTRITKKEGTLSFELEKRCKEAIERSTLQKTSPGKPAEKTTGEVTFYLSIK
ncbi:MAG: cell envelope integrity protein TolA [Cyclobacteriaceae bacterium]|nr:cell envelope integrity protein TolA [Cyclobacteriaceae bacterium]